jgi:hypothetical protein
MFFNRPKDSSQETHSNPVYDVAREVYGQDRNLNQKAEKAVRKK